jgi:hypothetical protein
MAQLTPHPRRACTDWLPNRFGLSKPQAVLVHNLQASVQSVRSHLQHLEEQQSASTGAASNTEASATGISTGSPLVAPSVPPVPPSSLHQLQQWLLRALTSHVQAMVVKS